MEPIQAALKSFLLKIHGRYQLFLSSSVASDSYSWYINTDWKYIY